MRLYPLYWAWALAITGVVLITIGFENFSVVRGMFGLILLGAMLLLASLSCAFSYGRGAFSPVTRLIPGTRWRLLACRALGEMIYCILLSDGQPTTLIVAVKIDSDLWPNPPPAEDDILVVEVCAENVRLALINIRAHERTPTPARAS